LLQATPSSSVSFGKTIEDHYLPERTIVIANEFGLVMNITIEIDQKSDYMVRIDFFNKTTGNKIMITSLQDNDLLDLATKYRLYVNHLSENTTSLPSKDTWNIKSKLISIKNVTKIKVIAKNLFQELRRMNVSTIDSFRDIVFARTTIELDADIVTIISPDLPAVMSTQTNKILLLLHTCNLYVVNHLFMHRIHKFSSILKTLTSTLKVISVSAWLILNLSLIFSSHHLVSEDSVSIAVQMIKLIGIPPLLWKFIPKIIGYVLKYQVTRSLQL
jgi:hypothetical protein